MNIGGGGKGAVQQSHSSCNQPNMQQKCNAHTRSNSKLLRRGATRRSEHARANGAQEAVPAHPTDRSALPHAHPHQPQALPAEPHRAAPGKPQQSKAAPRRAGPCEVGFVGLRMSARGFATPTCEPAHPSFPVFTLTADLCGAEEEGLAREERV